MSDKTDASPDPLAWPMSQPFDLAQSRKGYRINRFARSMRDAANRAAFLADEVGYMNRLGLDAGQQRLVRERDWVGLQAAGGNQYALVKLAGALGVSLIQEGAILRGQSVEEFLRTRPIRRPTEED